MYIFMTQISITLVPKEVGELWDEIYEEMMTSICHNSYPPPPNQPLKEIIPHTYNANYNLHVGKCYKQYTSNLCGYHATFNTLCFLNIINRTKNSYNISTAASFWTFKKKIQKFLFSIKHHHKLNQWPWTDHDILYGDFQRTYNKICMQNFDDFEIFRDHLNCQLLSFTWEFQYKNLLVSEEKREELNQLINYFLNWKNEKTLIISFMLAITNHWMCFFAVKSAKSTQYWFFDSNNRPFLDLDQKEIEKLVEEIDEEKLKKDGKRYSSFFKGAIGVCMVDTQISLKLLIDCFEGKTNIDHYVYNQQFNVFMDRIHGQLPLGDVKAVAAAIKDYEHNIQSFFNRRPSSTLSIQNQVRFIDLKEFCVKFEKQSTETQRLLYLLRKYERTAKF